MTMDLNAIAKDAAERVHKNGGCVPQLAFAPILWALQDAMTDVTNGRGGEEPVAHPEPVDVKAAVELVENIIGAIEEQIIWNVHAHPGHRPDIYGEEAAAEIIYEKSMKPLLSLIDRLQADNERMVEERERLRSGFDEIICWFGEAPHTFPDWKTCAECLSEIAQNVLDGLPPLTDPEARQRLQCSGGGDPT